MKVEFDFENKIITVSGEFKSFKELKDICKGKEGWRLVANEVVLLVEKITDVVYVPANAYQNGSGVPDFGPRLN